MVRASQNGREELIMETTLSGRNKSQPANMKKAEGKES